MISNRASRSSPWWCGRIGWKGGVITSPAVPRVHAPRTLRYASGSRSRSHTRVWGSTSTDATPGTRSRTSSILPYARSTASVQFRPTERSPPMRRATGDDRSSNLGGFSGSGSSHRRMSPGWYPWKWNETVVIGSRRTRPPVRVDLREEGIPRLDLLQPLLVSRGEAPRHRGAREGEKAVERGGVEIHPGLRVVARGDRRDQERPVGGLEEKELPGERPQDAVG